MAKKNIIEYFSFGLMVYNQEKLVIETLESIKYQISNYGKKMKFELIIVDDNSSDNTVRNINYWLKKNHELFSNVNFKSNKENLGTVKNYNYLLSKIKNQNFKILAGDDLFGSISLFKQYNNLDNATLRTFVKICLKDDKLYYDSEYLSQYYYNSRKYNKNKLLARFRRGNYIHTPSTLFKKNLYEYSNCTELNSKFRLFEDDPTWYSIIKNLKDSEIQFKDEAIVLYRIHNKSVSNSIRVKKTEFDYEMEKLHRIYYEDSKNVYEKIYWYFKNKEKIAKLFNVSKYVDFVIRMKFHMIKKTGGFKKFEQDMNIILNREQVYYRSIHINSEKFIKEML